jgi:hypothetical protein
MIQPVNRKKKKPLHIHDFTTVRLITYEYEKGRRKMYKGAECVMHNELQHKMNYYQFAAFQDFIIGQTISMIGNEPAYYIDDVDRFVRGLPVID